MRYLTKAEYRSLKTKLTRDVNRFEKARTAFLNGSRTEELWIDLRRAALKLESTAKEGLWLFDHEVITPDDWHRWNIAARDAEYVLQYY